MAMAPPRKPIDRASAALLAVVLLLGACATTPTGRRQLQFFPADQVAQMGESAYGQLLKQEPTLPPEHPIGRYVQCVVDALIAVVPPPEGGGEWDVTVFAGEQVNAFALPGGNIGVYAGLLRAARAPAQLAAVIGHEIAHVQAEHANARLSTQFAADAGLQLIQVLGQGTAVESQTAMSLLGLGAQVGLLLPFSRAQESEADILGLRYMAQAGFDPRAAVTLWQNMAQVAGGQEVPTFLSTHPSGAQRIETLNREIPRALETWRRAQAEGRTPSCRPPA
jgi:predicted Zn-dependent protease